MTAQEELTLIAEQMDLAFITYTRLFRANPEWAKELGAITDEAICALDFMRYAANASGDDEAIAMALTTVLEKLTEMETRLPGVTHVTRLGLKVRTLVFPRRADVEAMPWKM